MKSADVQTTKITYIVNDRTGPSIEVQMWLGETDVSCSIQITINIYFKFQNNFCSALELKVRFNDIFYLSITQFH